MTGQDRPEHMLRMLFCLVQSMEKNKLSGEEVAGIKALEGHVEAHTNPQHADLAEAAARESVYSGARLVKVVLMTEMKEEVIRALFCKVGFDSFFKS